MDIKKSQIPTPTHRKKTGTSWKMRNQKLNVTKAKQTSDLKNPPSSFSFPLNVQRALIAERIIQFLRHTPEHDGSGSSVTAFGTEQQGVGPFQGFGKCAESQRRMETSPSLHPGVGSQPQNCNVKKEQLPGKSSLMSVHMQKVNTVFKWSKWHFPSCIFKFLKLFTSQSIMYTAGKLCIMNWVYAHPFTVAYAPSLRSCEHLYPHTGVFVWQEGEFAVLVQPKRGRARKKHFRF